MTKARLVAQLIANRVMAEGHIAGAPQHVGSAREAVSFAFDHGKEAEYEQTDAFTSLQVVSIVSGDGRRAEGDDPGTPDEVVIYAAGRLTNSFIDSLPPEIGGVRVTVEKSTLVGVNPEQAEAATPEPRLYIRDGRIACGSSCGTATGFPGTMGALVKRDGDDSLFILSCNHVLAACNCIRLGMPIMSPAVNDSKPDGPVPLAIGRLTKSIELRQGHFSHDITCEVDAALGRVLDPSYVSSWQGDAPGYETPVEIIDPERLMKIKKFGRSTGLTYGMIGGSVEGNMAIPYQAKEFKGTMWFKNHSLVVGGETPFALPGDSGSLVVSEDGSAAIGLLFASNVKGELAYIIPIRRVLEALGVSLVSGHPS